MLYDNETIFFFRSIVYIGILRYKKCCGAGLFRRLRHQLSRFDIGSGSDYGSKFKKVIQIQRRYRIFQNSNYSNSNKTFLLKSFKNNHFSKGLKIIISRRVTKINYKKYNFTKHLKSLKNIPTCPISMARSRPDSSTVLYSLSRFSFDSNPTRDSFC